MIIVIDLKPANLFSALVAKQDTIHEAGVRSVLGSGSGIAEGFMI